MINSRIILEYHWLPLPPNANMMYRHVGGRTLLSREARDYYSTVATLLPCLEIPAKTPLELTVTYFLTKQMMNRRDLDNCLKALIDGIFKASKGEARANDVYIRRLNSEKVFCDGVEVTPGCRVTLETIEGV